LNLVITISAVVSSFVGTSMDGDLYGVIQPVGPGRRYDSLLILHRPAIDSCAVARTTSRRSRSPDRFCARAAAARTA
jgi:hypothetical protein